MKSYLMLIPLLATLGCNSPKSERQNSLETIADVNATDAARQTFTRMRQLSAKGYMIGHQDALAYGYGWYGKSGETDSDFRAVCKDYPAVFGWDLGKIEHQSAHNLDSVVFDDMRRYMIRAHSVGGINTVSWHSDNIVTGGNSWDVSTDKVVESILPGGDNHQKYLVWLDNFAQFITSVKDDKGELVPILFRPYHELGGSWFWWGRNLCTPEQYRDLWKMTFNYLTVDKQIHNLIYCYSMSSFGNEQELMERYPGDEYVDMIGFDIYQGDVPQSRKEFIGQLTAQTTLCSQVASQRNKLFAITEGGYESIPENDWFTQVVHPSVKDQNVSYILFWRNAYNKENHFYVPYPGHSSEADFVNFVSNDSVFMASDVREIFRGK